MKKIVLILAIALFSCTAFAQTTSADSSRLKQLNQLYLQQKIQIEEQLKNLEKNIAERRALIIAEMENRNKFAKKQDSIKMANKPLKIK